MLRRRVTSRGSLLRRRRAAPPAPAACPACRTPLAPQEAFCSRCGTQVRATTQERLARRRRLQAAQAKHEMSRKISNGRIWILVVSLITLVGGVYQYASAQDGVEKGIALTEQNLRLMDAGEKAEFQEVVVAETGMRWDAAVRQARSEVRLLLVASLVLAAVYFGLYLWANHNPFPAAMVALLLFLAGIAVQFMISPALALSGWLLKFLTIAGIGSAVSAAHRYRRAYGGDPGTR